METPAKQPSKPAALYRPADVEAIQERWRAFAPTTDDTRRSAALASSTGGGVFPEGSILDARNYGACDVFDLHLPLYPYITILDCVDRHEQLPGYFHIATVCADEDRYGNPPARIVYVRATDRNRGVCHTPAEEEGSCTGEYHDEHGWFLPIKTEINGEDHEFRHHNEPGYHMLPFKWDDDLYESLVDKVAQGSGSLTFSIHHQGHVDAGAATLTSNDAAAAVEHQQRCKQ